MSEHRRFQLSCTCGHEFETKLWDALNVTEAKELKGKLLSGEINQVQCPKCQKKSYIEKSLLYHDMDQRLWVQMLPQADRPKWPELQEEYQEEIKKNSGPFSNRKYHFRLAFGREELLEKIRIFDANLDDRILELLKVRILTEDETLKTVSDAKVLFSRYMPQEEELHFSVTSQEKSLSQTIVIAFQHYNDIRESKEHVEATTEIAKIVCKGMYVHYSKTRVLH